MSIKQFIYKIKEYLNEQMFKEIQKIYGEPIYDISEEDVKMLLYYIDNSEEILKKYGSLKKWEKSMKKNVKKIYNL
jgi:hypothetical protein